MNGNWHLKISSRSLLILTGFMLSISIMLYSCQNAAQLQQDIYYTNGRDLYIKHCQNCHGSKAEGFGALTPPLTDSTYLKANKSKLACLIKNGISGPIRIHNKDYNDKMPGFPGLANIDIAQLIVFVTNAHGNHQGMYTTDQVTTDLNNCE
ncbi:cytochrome c [Pedobacter sp. MC2016-14]|uniref:c-type cytochrome n=1 Tax=Pedobacter sp. MC2016-14 TaxID=2897327 RepID=UPI001E5E2420|nr:cytochrome c [Pedobacter sp. MC2016-14]MCD0490181.1 cytochrome c [Pedobacter sp. MC2016-14]